MGDLLKDSNSKAFSGTSTAVQRLRLCAPRAGDISSFPGWETRAPPAPWCSQKTNRKKKKRHLKKIKCFPKCKNNTSGTDAKSDGILGNMYEQGMTRVTPNHMVTLVTMSSPFPSFRMNIPESLNSGLLQHPISFI